MGYRQDFYFTLILHLYIYTVYTYIHHGKKATIKKILLHTHTIPHTFLFTAHSIRISLLSIAPHYNEEPSTILLSSTTSHLRYYTSFFSSFSRLPVWVRGDGVSFLPFSFGSNMMTGDFATTQLLSTLVLRRRWWWKISTVKLGMDWKEKTLL